MSNKPKRHLPGQVVHLTRRTTHRKFMLRPGKQTRELVGYMYGKAALDHAQQPCVAVCLTNHMTSTQLDLLGQRSRFMQQFHSNTARKRNLQIDHRESLWAPVEPGDMVCLDMDAIIEKVLYTCLQPVAAGLVDRCEEWTGFKILPRDWGKPMRFPRPDLCGDDMPEHVKFTPMPPPGFEDQPLEEVIAFFEELIAEREAYYRKRRKIDVLGIEYCEAVNHFRAPKTKSKMRTLNPRFTCKDKRLILAAIQRERRFHREHRMLLNAYRDGDRSVVFPAGTLQMVRLAGVRTEDLADDDPHRSRWEWTERLRTRWTRFQSRRAA